MIAGARRIGEGSPDALGVTPDRDGANVAVFSAHADTIELCLFDEAGEKELERIALPQRTGDIFHAHVGGLAAGTRYGLRAHGPYAPGEGHRFNGAKLLVDPYALALDRPYRLDPAMFGFSAGTDRPDGTDSAPVMPKAIVMAPTAEPSWTGARPWPETVISEVHIKGFTKRHPDVPEAVRGTFAGLAVPAVIDHLKKLGVTAVELMPAMAWVDERHLGPLGLTNYWGYNPVTFLASDPKLAPGGWAEVRAATAALNAAGIEVILDVVYNHSGESDEFGPTLSFRGLDNASYYRLDPNNPARYVNDAGCGNILACDHPAVIRMVMDSLRAWAQFGGINGFRFDLAPVLGRRPGFDPSAPLLAAIEQDPTLSRLKMIAEPWDIGPGGYQLGRFSGRWAEWNDRYRDTVRKFWRGDGTPADLAGRITGSADPFWFKRRPSRSVNFVTAHDGFTLADLVSYTQKRNGANGENNRDGTDDNHSWNCGVEGPTGDLAIQAKRSRDQKNLLATLMMSRGTPMLGPSSERGLTQGGNNNAYAQDNESVWTDWSSPEDLTAFIARLIAVRHAHPALTDDRFLGGKPVGDATLPDVEWRRLDGSAPTPDDWNHPQSRSLVAVFAPPAGGAGGRVIVAFNAGDAQNMMLPEGRWRVLIDTAAADDAPERTVSGGNVLELSARSVVVAAEDP